MGNKSISTICIINALSTYLNTYTIGEFDDSLFFTVTYGNNNNFGLGVTDGTTKGTRLIRAIDSDFDPYTPSGSAELNDIYFTANDGVNGNELWVSDGTAEGTSFVAELYGGIPVDDTSAGAVSAASAAAFFIDELHVVGNELFV